jgi:glutathione synthase/RimK-type ligase-like ATP-grasp enzyme
MAPSSPASIKHFARIAEKHSVDVEPITKRQLAELAEFDGLFIRETTSIDNHTYRFARRAWQEGMPVIDDPISMIRCTNKVFLMELLGQNQVPTPPTVIIAEDTDLAKPIDELGLPLVVKIPTDRSRAACTRSSRSPGSSASVTSCSRKPICCWRKNSCRRVRLARGCAGGRAAVCLPVPHGPGHWQIVKHRADGSSREGGFKTFGVDQAPPALIDIAVRAARPIGDGFYGVDIKQTDSGFVVMEVNDNPNLEHGIEDVVGRDEVWVRLLKWFIERFEQ